MRCADRLCRRTVVRCWAALTAAAVMMLPPSNTALGENAAVPADVQRAKPTLESAQTTEEKTAREKRGAGHRTVTTPPQEDGADHPGARAERRQAEGFPWPYVLQLQHDKPLVVEGHVLDSAGRPVQGAHVTVIADLAGALVPLLPDQVLGQATTDANGDFHATMPSLPFHQCVGLRALAWREGYGCGKQDLEVDVLEHDVAFRLEQEQPVRGRLVGPEGRPAAGVRVHLRSFTERLPQGQFGSYVSLWPPGEPPAAWPAPVSDDQGHFVLRGIPRTSAPELDLLLEVDDPRFAPEVFRSAIPSDGTGQVERHLSAPRIVEGTVICRDTKAPMADAWLLVVVNRSPRSPGDEQGHGVDVRTDRRGRFRARCRPGKYLVIYVYPPAGMSYPAWVQGSTPLPADALPQEVTVEVPRGLLLRGKVVEAGSGAPVAGASVEYQNCVDKSPYSERPFTKLIYWAAEYRRIVTDSDGTFQLGVVPGPGHLLVKAPTPDFISRYVTRGELQLWDAPGSGGSGLYCVEGLLKIDPQPGTEPAEVTIPLRRGVTVRGRMVGPQGEVVEKAALLDRSFTYVTFGPYGLWPRPRPVRDGRFEVRGCDPEKPQRVFFLDVGHQWGATATLEAPKAQQEPPEVRLLPCGSASVCFVDEESRPLANRLLVREGQPIPIVALVALEARERRNHAVWSMLSRSLDRKRYIGLQTDAEGRVAFPTLVPGAPYKLFAFGAADPQSIENDFTVKPGEALDLGTIPVKWPTAVK